MAVGILEFNEKQVDLKIYEKFLQQFKPLGRDKRVMVRLINYKPMEVAGKPTKGMVQKIGGIALKMPLETIQFPTKFDNKGMPSEYTEGTLRYYERKTPGPSPVSAPAYKPERLSFVSGCLVIDAKNDALLLFMTVSGKNKMNRRRQDPLNANKEIGWAHTPPVWEIVEPLASASKNVKKLNVKAEAFARVNLVLKSDHELAKQLYESQGYSDFTMYVKQDANGVWKGDWTEIKNVLLTLADNNPQKVLDLLSDTALDITSKIVRALNLQVLAQEADRFYWGPNAADGKYKELPAADKEIVKIPKGKTATKELILEWFCDWLKGEPEVMSEINTELDAVALANSE